MNTISGLDTFFNASVIEFIKKSNKVILPHIVNAVDYFFNKFHLLYSAKTIFLIRIISRLKVIWLKPSFAPTFR